TTTALLILSVHLSMSLSPYKHETNPRTPYLTFNPALLGTPYLVFALFASIGVGLAMQHPDKVSREQRYFYCSLDWPAYTDAVTIVSTLVCLTAVAMEVRVWRLLSRNWRGVRESDIDVDLIVRTSIFTSYLFASTLINLAANWSKALKQSAAPDLITASVGMALFFIFASHRAVLRTWAFWNRHPGNTPPTSHRPSQAPSSFLQMPTLEHDASASESSSHTYQTSESMIKQYYDGKIGPQTRTHSPHFPPPQPQPQFQPQSMPRDAGGGGVIIIRKPEEAFTGYPREKDVRDFRDSASMNGSVMSGDEQRQYIPSSPRPTGRKAGAGSPPRQTAVTHLDYERDPHRVSSLRGYVPTVFRVDSLEFD
ncbi:hypothetical protein EIP91_006576, partial [Steccherinum ochraceum]